MPPEYRYTKMSINLPKQVAAEADIICSELNIPRNALICIAVAAEVARHKREKLQMIEVEERLALKTKTVA
jgi:predicted transcriptional regulator